MTGRWVVRLLRLTALLALVLAQGACGMVQIKTPGGKSGKSTESKQSSNDDDSDEGSNTGKDDVAIEDFTEPLEKFGEWVEVAPYGKVWQPSDDAAGEDFVPYATDGQWTLNDDDDWVFESTHEDDFGWATFHYGRWVQNDEYGWVWIPGTTWAPAWVEWRYGGGYVGWVPRHPEGVTPPREHWVFVEDKHFMGENPATHRLENGTEAWGKAPAITETRGEGSWFRGPPPEKFKDKVKKVHKKKPGKGKTKKMAKKAAKKPAKKKSGGAKKKSGASKSGASKSSSSSSKPKSSGSSSKKKK